MALARTGRSAATRAHRQGEERRHLLRGARSTSRPADTLALAGSCSRIGRHHVPSNGEGVESCGQSQVGMSDGEMSESGGRTPKK